MQLDLSGLTKSNILRLSLKKALRPSEGENGEGKTGRALWDQSASLAGLANIGLNGNRDQEDKKTKRLKDRITKIQLLQVYQTVGPEGKVRNKVRQVFKEGDTNCRNQIKQVFEEEEENYNNEDERSRIVRCSGSQDKGEEVQILKEDKK